MLQQLHQTDQLLSPRRPKASETRARRWGSRRRRLRELLRRPASRFPLGLGVVHHA
jgi:hypothetical protein